MTLQNASKCLLGSPLSSVKKGSEDFASDPDIFEAGLAVRRTSAGLLSVAKAAGGWCGISLGKSLSSHKNTTVLKAGDMIPVLLEATPPRGVVTITSYANLVLGSNDTLKVGATTFTFKASPSTSTEVGAVTSNNQTATNLAAKINAHSTAGALFIAQAVGAEVTITAKNNDTDPATIDLVYTDVGGSDIGLTVDAATFTGGGSPDFVAIGKPVYFSDTTGKADDPESASTVSNAVYASGVLTGVKEDGVTTAYAAYVNAIGGL